MKKMKIIMVIIALLMTSQVFSAKKNTSRASTSSSSSSGGAFPMQKGDFLFGPTLGLGSSAGGILIGVDAEYGIVDHVGLGLKVGYWSYSYGFFSYNYNYTVIPIVFSGAYHFDIGNPKIDLGVGLGLGYYIYSVSYTDSTGNSITNLTGLTGVTNSGIRFDIFGIFRYFVTPSIALRARLGYSYASILEVGVDFKF